MLRRTMIAVLALELASVASMADVGQLLRQNAVVPVEPPIEAVEFELPRLGGGRGSLSDFRGQWVLLTFWASWCGPCRMEMPTLERLHQERGAEGLAVVGVSLDSSIELATSFADELGLDSPQFWDEAGEIGAAYRASAIPLTYIIDPAGRVVGTSRGARDWLAVGPMLDALLDPTAMADLPPADEAQAGSAELPAVLNPPSAEVVLVESSARVGREFHLDIRMRWVGTLEEYLPQPPKVTLPEGVSIESMVASTDSRDSGEVVAYRVTLKADRAGRFALDPVELRYIPSSTGSPVVSLVEGPTVDVRASGLRAVKPAYLVIAAGVLLVIVAVALVFMRKRSTPDATPDTALDRYRDLRERLDSSRALRVEGRHRELALVLTELELELLSEDDAERQRLEELIETLRFGGQTPSIPELEQMQRRVERRIDELQPDPDAVVRSRLQLQKESS